MTDETTSTLLAVPLGTEPTAEDHSQIKETQITNTIGETMDMVIVFKPREL